MSRCPHCRQPLSIPNRVYYNVEAYGKSCKATTSCCGNMVRVACVIRFDIQAIPDKGEDDWNVPTGSRSKGYVNKIGWIEE